MTEVIANVIYAHFGLDSSGYSFGYLSSWKGIDSKMQRIGRVVQEVAGEVMRKEAPLTLQPIP